MSNRGKPTVSVESLGCKLNQAEAQQMERELAAAGYRLVAPEDAADIYILNTCTVTHIADRKSRHLLRLARRRNPAARLVVTGCYAERAPRELACLEGVELVLGNDLKDSLVARLDGVGKVSAAAWPPRPEKPSGQSAHARLYQGPGRLPRRLRLLYRAAGQGPRKKCTGGNGARAGTRKSGQWLPRGRADGHGGRPVRKRWDRPGRPARADSRRDGYREGQALLAPAAGDLTPAHRALA